ncbi:MAG: hypothetical protein DWQ01_20305 [Planctomycetota bacterium]|nr:MAG: hypothetical protein DWQ01_20305 [Planctomycetota bacterium]
MKIFRTAAPGTSRRRFLLGTGISARIRPWSLLLAIAACQPEAKEVQVGQDSETGVESVVERGSVQFKVRFEPESLSLSDIGRLSLQIDAPADYEWPAFSFEGEWADFEVLEVSRDVVQSLDDGRLRHRIEVKLEPQLSGKLQVPPIPLPFRQRQSDPDPEVGTESEAEYHTVESDPLEIEVRSLLAEEMVSLNQLRPATPPAELEAPPNLWLPWLAVALPFVGILLWLARRWLRSRALEAQPPGLSPRETALQALDHLVAQKLPDQGQTKEFYVQLTFIVRRFIEALTGVRAPEQTTEEFLRAIHHHPAFGPAEQMELARFLEAADLVKYGAAQADVQALTDSLDISRQFLTTFAVGRPQAMEATA